MDILKSFKEMIFGCEHEYERDTQHVENGGRSCKKC